MLQADSTLAPAKDAGPSYAHRDADREDESDFAPRDAAGIPVAISLFADRPHVREAMRADAELAGFRIAQAAPLGVLKGARDQGQGYLMQSSVRWGDSDQGHLGLGDIAVVDVPTTDAATMAALDRLAQRIARSGARLIVSTTIGALEPAIVATSAADPVLLVEPGRAERLVAFGEALAGMVRGRVREMSEEDRLAVMRLVERVTMLAEKLDGLVGDDEPRDGSSAFAFGTGASPSAGGALREHRPGQSGDDTPGLPDPRLIRATIRKRQLRSRFFDAALFADPAWDILLDLTAARAEGRRVSVTSLCIASGVPPTTALRWIAQMTDQGLLVREEDLVDRRRAFVALSDKAVTAMARYFEAAGNGNGTVL